MGENTPSALRFFMFKNANRGLSAQLRFRIVIGLVGRQISIGSDLLQIVYKRCGRHARKVSELPVEMAMIRIAILVE